jgi:cytochrome c biogenesis protein CcmG/thiol:disulfide interchange protein DsbE
MESELLAAEPTQPKRHWGVYIVWAALLGLLAVVAVGLFRAQQGPVGVGSSVPDFSLTTFDGQVIHSEDLEGNVYVLNFWASWCKPCEQEARELEQAYQLFKDEQVFFLGVDYVDTEPEARAYLEKFAITYPNGPDLGTKISQSFRIRGVPETFIIDGEGRIAAVRFGPYIGIDQIIKDIRLAQAGS